MWNMMKLFYLFWCFQISGEHKLYPVELYTSHEFQVNSSVCHANNKLEVLCDTVTECMVPNVSYVHCNKTKHGVQMWIPLKPRCDTVEIKCVDNVIYKRNLLKYKIPTELKSTYNLTDDHLIVISKAVGIYPGGVCKFQITKHNSTDVILSSVNASTEKNGDLYDATCNFSIPTTTLFNGYYDVNISVYPSTLSAVYGRNDYLRIFIGLKVSLSNCHQNFTYFNQTINCTCVRSDSYQITAQPMWYDGRHVVQFNGSSTLSLHEFNNNHVYYCVTKQHNISSNKLKYRIVFQGVSLTTKENEIFASSISVALLLFAVILFCVVIYHKHKCRKHCQFTETSIPGDDGLELPPLHPIEMANEHSYHYINDVNPDPLVNQSHYYSNVQVELVGPLRQKDDPPMGRRIVESLDLQTISGLNDGYLTPLDVDSQITDTMYQNSQSTNAYVTIIDHYSTID